MPGSTFNNATLTFNGATAKLKSMGFNEEANSIDITTLQDSNHVHEGGIPNEEVTATVGGYFSEAAGTKGALTLNWDGTNSDSIATALLSARNVSGDLDDELTTELTFQRSV